MGGGLTEGVVPLTLDSGVSSLGFMLAVPGRGPAPVPGREAAAEEEDIFSGPASGGVSWN